MQRRVKDVSDTVFILYCVSVTTLLFQFGNDLENDQAIAIPIAGSLKVKESHHSLKRNVTPCCSVQSKSQQSIHATEAQLPRQQLLTTGYMIQIRRDVVSCPNRNHNTSA